MHNLANLILILHEASKVPCFTAEFMLHKLQIPDSRENRFRITSKLHYRTQNFEKLGRGLWKCKSLHIANAKVESIRRVILDLKRLKKWDTSKLTSCLLQFFSEEHVNKALLLTQIYNKAEQSIPTQIQAYRNHIKFTTQDEICTISNSDLPLDRPLKEFIIPKVTLPKAISILLCTLPLIVDRYLRNIPLPTIKLSIPEKLPPDYRNLLTPFADTQLFDNAWLESGIIGIIGQLLAPHGLIAKTQINQDILTITFHEFS